MSGLPGIPPDRYCILLARVAVWSRLSVQGAWIYRWPKSSTSFLTAQKSGNMTELISTQCPICSSDKEDRQVYAATFSPEQLTPELFSPRRMPDRIHYRMVICEGCGLMRADPALSSQALGSYYEASGSHEAVLARQAAATYMEYFRRYFSGFPCGSKVLEAGCGNGEFLRELQRDGFHDINGVEPSRAAAEQAGGLRDSIYNGMFGPGIYPEGYFDLICAFHLLDHISDPKKFLSDCRAYLKSQGRLFLILHDVSSWPARLLGPACPVIDIEHPFLYNKATVTRLLEKSGFKVQKSFRVYNCYPLRYWVQLTPLAGILKRPLMALLQGSVFGRVPLTLGAGNMGVIAVKKDE